MTAAEIERALALVTQGVQWVKTGMEVLSDAKAALSSDDEEALQAMLSELQAINDADYARVVAKLAEAGKK